jgi:hypothetical protein
MNHSCSSLNAFFPTFLAQSLAYGQRSSVAGDEASRRASDLQYQPLFWQKKLETDCALRRDEADTTTLLIAKRCERNCRQQWCTAAKATRL